MIFYICINGKKEKKTTDLNNSFNIPEFEDNKSPFIQDKKDNTIISNRTQLKYIYKNKNDFEDINRDIYFTRKFS